MTNDQFTNLPIYQFTNLPTNNLPPEGGTMPVYLVAAYAVFWGLTFALVFSIWARQRRLERELETLKKAHPSDQ